MGLVRALSRLLLAGMFVYGGLDSLRNPGSKVPRARVVTEPLADAVELDQDPEVLVQVNGAVQVGGGVLLALGILPRLSATALAASLIPTTAAGHRFWEETDPSTRAQQTIHFLKNAAMFGGLLAVIGSPRVSETVVFDET
jgi:putative oxidoreductase